MFEELRAAIERYRQALRDHEQTDRCLSFSNIEIAKIDIADAILRDRHIPLGPRPPLKNLTPLSCSRKTRKAITQGKRRKVMERDLYRCLSCGTHVDLTVDHIYPWSRGGTNDEDNLQTLCRTCNSAKGSKVTSEH